MKNIKISDDEKKLISEMHQERFYLLSEQSIKYGMKDSSGSSKIKDLQTKLQIKSPTTGKSIATGYFGDLTVSTLMSKAPDLYKGKNDVIDDQKYQKIMSKLGGQQTTGQQPQLSQTTAKGVDFNSLWSNFPKKSSAGQIFPNIFPTAYQKSPDSFSNACATRLSLALNNLGKKPIAQFVTEKDWSFNGVNYKKGSPITVRAKSTPEYLTSMFGPPSFKGPNTQENVNKYIKGKNAIFVLTNVPGWTATGHADIVRTNNGALECGHACYLGGDVGGTLQAWYV